MSDTLDTFRDDTRAWLEANCPPEMRTPIARDSDVCWGGRNAKLSGPQRAWLDAMGAKGWTVPEWPAAYGGGGLSKDEAKVLASELRRIGARSPLSSFGIWMLGPALLKYGSEAQKLDHIPKIARGEIRWCQGYSEPGAGSDLASLRTSAVLDGNEYVVNGQKVWTSYADKADWIFCLVRTHPEAPKHLGISFLLFDMASPGVTTSPIRLISGASPFCQTFFDDVRVPAANLMGEAGKGWDIAKYLLTHEREMIGAMDFTAGGRDSVSQIAARTLGTTGGMDGAVLSDAMLRTDIVRHEIDAWAFGLTMERVKDEAKAGQGVGALSSMLKYYGTELNKSRQELLMSVGGSDALAWEDDAGDQSRAWLRSRANSIEGGTSEINLNIIAKRVLQLPGA